MSIAARKTIGPMLQKRPPIIGGRQFTFIECKEWFLNPSITKAVLSYLVYNYDDDTDSITFDQTSEESVT